MRTPDGIRLHEQVRLADKTTLGLGGRARWLVEITAPEAAGRAVAFARSLDDSAPLVLGGGSNVLVADEGYPGVVLQFGPGGGLVVEHAGDSSLVSADAGVEWDALVQAAVAAGLQGLECLSGIPGRVGAAPVQNIGAYGQEVGDVTEDVQVVDLTTGATGLLTASELAFGYRTSRLKREAGRLLVTRLRLRLSPNGRPVTSYRDVAARLENSPAPTLAEVRQTVLAVRRDKSMLIDPSDPNHRSAGSFFMNPIVDETAAQALVARFPTMPSYPAANGRKLSAAWLIEHSGVVRGTRHGNVGVSTRHVLALVNVDGRGTTAELLAFAAFVRRRVFDAFGVVLEPEPVFIGFPPGSNAVLGAPS